MLLLLLYNYTFIILLWPTSKKYQLWQKLHSTRRGDWFKPSWSLLPSSGVFFFGILQISLARTTWKLSPTGSVSALVGLSFQRPSRFTSSSIIWKMSLHSSKNFTIPFSFLSPPAPSKVVPAELTHWHNPFVFVAMYPIEVNICYRSRWKYPIRWYLRHFSISKRPQFPTRQATVRRHPYPCRRWVAVKNLQMCYHHSPGLVSYRRHRVRTRWHVCSGFAYWWVLFASHYSWWLFLMIAIMIVQRSPQVQRDDAWVAGILM